MDNVCKICDHKFSTKYSLARHLKSKKSCDKNTNNVIEFKCDICRKNFTTKQILQRHQNKKLPCIPYIEKLEEENKQLKKQITTTDNDEVKQLKDQIKFLTLKLQNDDFLKSFNTGLIYLIQPEELFGTNRYKFGYSDQNNLKRVKSYGSNVKVFIVYSSNKAKELESYILELLSEKHLKIKNEYFEIDDIDDVKNFILSSCINF